MVLSHLPIARNLEQFPAHRFLLHAFAWPCYNGSSTAPELARPQQCYVGLTSNPAARLAAHNAGESPHTTRFKLWRVLVVRQTCAARSLARTRPADKRSSRKEPPPWPSRV